MPLPWRRSVERVAPYVAIAPIYDHLMRHVNYLRWASYVIGWFGHAEGAVQSVLEVACGTGSLLVELASAGYRVCGFDDSPAMVRQARRKLQARGWLLESGEATNDPAVNGGHLWCGDMREFGMRYKFDVALCLYDSINYCPTLSTVEATLQGIAGAVRPGGLLIFDVCTEGNCRKYFANYVERDGTEHFSYTRRAFFDAHSRRQINDFFVVDEREGLRYQERHEQQMYRLDELRALGDSAAWRVLDVCEGFTRRPGGESSDRVHFILKRR